VIDYEGRFDFPVPPEEIWAAITQPEQFESWWAWLKEFRAEGPMLQEGSTLTGVVSPPLPYRMRIRVVIGDAEPLRRVSATIHGDLEGRAQLCLSPNGDGTHAEMAWTIEMMQLRMRLAALVAAPLLRWGHDRVVDATVLSFRRHLESVSGRGG
jgi:uncharacterized protein YndB with AHSA1/START domain